MPYFYECKTAEEAKAKYKELAKKLHPDKGGSAQAFKEMQAEYDRFDSIPLRTEAEKAYYGGFSYKRPNAGTSGFTTNGSGGFDGMKYTFNNIREQYEKNEQLQEYFKEIQRLTQANIQQENEISRLKNECNNLFGQCQHLNMELKRSVDVEIKVCDELEIICQHWLIGRLVKWLGLI